MLNKTLETELQRALNIAAEYKHEYVTHDHFFFALLHNKHIYSFLKNVGCNVEEIIEQQDKHLKTDFKHLIKKNLEYVKPSMSLNNALHDTVVKAYLNGGKDASEYDFFIKLIQEKDSYGKKLIENQGVKVSSLTNQSFQYYINDNISDNITNANKLPASEIKKISEVLMEMENQEAKNASKKKADTNESNPNPLEAFCVNLNQKAAAGGIDILVNRSAEIDRVLEILSRRQKNNPLLVGEPGVGKTAIIEGLALRIAQGNVPREFLNSVVYSLDVGSIVAGTKYRGDFEARIRDLLSELKNRKNIILFIDEIHTIVGAGSTTTASLDASNLLKPALARGEMRCIGSTTFAEFTVKFAKDAALVRRFQKIVIDEPDTSMTLKILEGIKPYYEKYHNVKYSTSALEAAISLSERYIHDRNLPDKAIDLIDESGARKKMHPVAEDNIVTEDDIEITISKTLNIPIANIDGSGGSKIKNLEKDLKKIIFGQDQAIKKIVSGVKLAVAGLRAYDEPACAYAFIGPSGTGKTELAVNLAKLCDMNLIRLDMSEYMEPHSVSRLIGSPPGYTGHDTGGILTEQVFKAPYSVILFDEIEKAHHEVFNLLLQVLDYGTLTDSSGRSVVFNHSIIILTSNLGSESYGKTSMGFIEHKDKKSLEAIKMMEKHFSSEFVHRLDDIIVFQEVSEEVAKKIIQKNIKDFEKQLQKRKIKLSVDKEVIDLIYKDCFGINGGGARSLEKTIDKEIKEKIVDEILFGKLSKGGNLVLTVKNQTISFELSNLEEECLV